MHVCHSHCGQDQLLQAGATSQPKVIQVAVKSGNEYLQDKECQNTVEKIKNEIKEYVKQYNQN
jgi:hypothetical protein